MKFKGKNYFVFVIPATILFIVIFNFGIAPYLNTISEDLSTYVFMFVVMAISLFGIYLAIRDEDAEKKKKQKDESKKSAFPDMKTNYKHLEKK